MLRTDKTMNNGAEYAGFSTANQFGILQEEAQVPSEVLTKGKRRRNKKVKHKKTESSPIPNNPTIKEPIKQAACPTKTNKPDKKDSHTAAAEKDISNERMNVKVEHYRYLDEYKFDLEHTRLGLSAREKSKEGGETFFRYISEAKKKLQILGEKVEATEMEKGPARKQGLEANFDFHYPTDPRRQIIGRASNPRPGGDSCAHSPPPIAPAVDDRWQFPALGAHRPRLPRHQSSTQTQEIHCPHYDHSLDTPSPYQPPLDEN